MLVGLILNQGLVPYDGNEAELDRLAAQAYRAYRKQKIKDPRRKRRGISEESQLVVLV